MNFRTFLPIFLLVLAIECFAKLFGILTLEFLAKPLLMVLLGYYFFSNTKNSALFKNLLLFSLFFSWLGDVFLLIENVYKSLFIFGLFAFLIAHILYVAYFWKIRTLNLHRFKLKPLTTICILIYTGSLYLILFPNLAGLKIPVLIYSSVITLMLLAVLHAFVFRKQTFGKICLMGALLFISSDSILAINRFYLSFYPAGTIIMLTYGLGQFFLVEGAIRNLRELKVK